MKKNRSFIMVFFLAAACASFPLASLAQEAVSVPFTAVEEEKKQSTSCCEKNWYLGGEFVYSRVKMDALNDYAAWINSTFSGNIEDFDYGPGFRAYLDFFIMENIGFGLGYEWLEADISGAYLGGTFGLDTKAGGPYASLLLRYILGKESNFSMGAKIGAGFYSAEYEEYDSGVLFQDGEDETVGYMVSLFSNYCLTDNLSIYLSGGYRILEFDDFNINMVSPGNPPVELDFSGGFATAGLTMGW